MKFAVDVLARKLDSTLEAAVLPEPSKWVSTADADGPAVACHTLWGEAGGAPLAIPGQQHLVKGGFRSAHRFTRHIPCARWLMQAHRHSRALYITAISVILACGATAQQRTVNLPCTGGFKGQESGTIIAVMPPDVPTPQGGLTKSGKGVLRSCMCMFPLGEKGWWGLHRKRTHVSTSAELTWAGGGYNGLLLGDTVGRTPGSYGFIVSCPLTGLLNPKATVYSATLVLKLSDRSGISPLGPGWTTPTKGAGPATLEVAMVNLVRIASSIRRDARGEADRAEVATGTSANQPCTNCFTSVRVTPCSRTLLNVSGEAVRLQSPPPIKRLRGQGGPPDRAQLVPGVLVGDDHRADGQCNTAHQHRLQPVPPDAVPRHVLKFQW